MLNIHRQFPRLQFDQGRLKQTPEHDLPKQATVIGMATFRRLQEER
jgi:hypothetical protein